MKRIVVYSSETGFTEKYANWIAEALGCEAKPFKQIQTSELPSYDMVIYGGWIFAGNVFGYDKIKELHLKNLFVFGVGMSLAKEETTDKIAKQNGLEKSRFFYFEGGYAPKKLGFGKRMMMNMIKKSIQKKTDKTEEDEYMLKTFEGADHTNRQAISGLLDAVSASKENGQVHS